MTQTNDESNIATIAKKILDNLDPFQAEEKSLKGRLETSQGLLSALSELHKKTSNPDSDTDLKTAIHKVTQLVNETLEANQKIKTEITDNLQKSLSESLEKFANSDEQKIRNHAFRTVKNTEGFKESFTELVKGAPQFVSIETLKNDLEAFLKSYHESMPLLSEDQLSKTKEAIAMLNAAAPLARELTILYLLDSYNGITENALESKIFDLAYDIQTAIEILKPGQSLIIPGGYVSGNLKPGGGSHAVLYQVQRFRENEYRFAIFNTGDGADFGQEVTNKFRMQFGIADKTSIPVYIDLPKAAVTDVELLTQIFKPQAKMTPRNGMPHIHEILERHFIQKYHAKRSVDGDIALQTWGKCSFDSVASFLSYKLNPSLYIPFEYDMLLRSRGALNSLLVKGKEDFIFKTSALEFIDKKSCETIAEWKKKFEEHCDPKDELMIANDIIGKFQIKDEIGLKNFIEKWSDYVFALEKAAREVDNQHLQELLEEALKMLFERMTGLPLILHAAGIDPIELLKAKGVTINNPEFFRMVEVLAGINDLISIGTPLLHLTGILSSDIHKTRDKWIQYVKILEKCMENTSPETLKVLKARRQAITPSTSRWEPLKECIFYPLNRPSLYDFNLKGLFDHLKTRFKEIALCVPPLLDPTYSPLKEAMQACNIAIVS